MDFAKLTTQGFQELAEQRHRHFVDNMWQRFGLKQSPGYFPIQVRPLLLFETTAFHKSYDNGAKIFLSDPSFEKKEPTEEDYKEFLYSIVHGSAHALHSKTRKFEYTNKVIGKEKARILLSTEILADYASLVYFKKYDPKNFQMAFWKATWEAELPQRLFLMNPNMLETLANSDCAGIINAVKREIGNFKNPYEEE